MPGRNSPLHSRGVADGHSLSQRDQKISFFSAGAGRINHIFITPPKGRIHPHRGWIPLGDALGKAQADGPRMGGHSVLENK